MKRFILLACMCLLFASFVNADYDQTYVNITMTETVDQNWTYGENFVYDEQREYCDITGKLNVSNPSSHTVQDILFNFTNTAEMKSNFTHIGGRNGTQVGNFTPGADWSLHIPEIRAGQKSVWQYNLSCDETGTPLNISSNYHIPRTGLQKKVLAGHIFRVNQSVLNTAPEGVEQINVTMRTQPVVWNDSEDYFNFSALHEVADYTNVTEYNSSVWMWEPAGGNLSNGENRTILYNVTAPVNVPTSNTYMALEEDINYRTTYLVSNLTITDVAAGGDIEITTDKQIVRPSQDQNDTNVTWEASANMTVPYNITYNVSKVTLWATHNMSPRAQAFDTVNTSQKLERNYTPTSLVNRTDAWTASAWRFNYTDGSSQDSPPPIVWMKPSYHIYEGNSQIISTNVTKSGTDLYMKYIYVVNGYWLQIDKNITSISNNTYSVNVSVENIGNAWTPRNLTVTAYDFVPTEFTAWDWSRSRGSGGPDYHSNVTGPNYNGTAYRWNIPKKPGRNASLGTSEPNSTWSASYKVNGTGDYKVSELYIVGLDPRKVDGAGTHEGITVETALGSATKEMLYAAGAFALLLLNVVNFVMTRNINRKLEK